MADLPDYYTQTQISEAEAAGFKGGLDANKSATPVSRDIYLATDTHILYVCFSDGTWTGFDAATITQGILTLYANMVAGGYRITGLGAPAAGNDAARKTYVDTLHALCLLLAGGTMSGAIAMGTNKITGMGDPTAAQDAATRAYVLAQCGLYLPLAGGTLTGDLGIGAYNLKTTNLLLKEYNTSWWRIRNAADTATRGLYLHDLYFEDSIRAFSDGLMIAAPDTNANYLMFKARDTDDALAEVARLAGAAVAYFQMTRPFVMSPYTGTLLAVEGAMGYDDDDKKVHYYDDAGEKILTAATKEIFVTPFYSNPVVDDNRGVLVNGAGEFARFKILIPQDFTSLTALEVIFLTTGAGANMHFDITTYYGAYNGGENYNVHTETADARDIGATVANQYKAHSISDLVDIAPLAAGDILYVSVEYDATSIASLAFLVGLRLKYN